MPGGLRVALPVHAGRQDARRAEDAPLPDPLIWLAYVAAVTSQIRLATGILILPQRNPVVLAKELATLDHLSGGRVELGIGVGWLEEEFDALGVPFAGRGRRTDEYVGALRALWSQDRASFGGEFTRFDECIVRPQPANGAIPIHVGGDSPAAARRAGRLGDGFLPARVGLDDLRTSIELARRARAKRDGIRRRWRSPLVACGSDRTPSTWCRGCPTSE